MMDSLNQHAIECVSVFRNKIAASSMRSYQDYLMKKRGFRVYNHDLYQFSFLIVMKLWERNQSGMLLLFLDSSPIKTS